jgi:cell division protein FtsB
MSTFDQKSVIHYNAVNNARDKVMDTYNKAFTQVNVAISRAIDMEDEHYALKATNADLVAEITKLKAENDKLKKGLETVNNVLKEIVPKIREEMNNIYETH